MPNPRPQVLPYIQKIPKAFLPLALRHNELVKLVNPVLNLREGNKILIAQNQNETVIAFRG